MLVLTRKVTQVIKIGDDIEIVIVRIGPNNVRIGIEAPKDVKVVRKELVVDCSMADWLDAQSANPSAIQHPDSD